MTVRRVAFLTAGGLAPCLSSAVGALIEQYTALAPDVEIIGYLDGYAGLLTGQSVTVTPDIRERAHLMQEVGGSPLGNSRVKLTNVEDCLKRGLIQEGQNPLHVAADQLTKDQVDVLHTIGGDDTNTTAADLAAYLAENDYALSVVGLPKTIDNDVFPIKQSLGAWTAAEQGALFAKNVIAEHSANPRMLIIHEVMGRNCGWLTAATAHAYHTWASTQQFAGFGIHPKAWDVHAVYIPELEIDIESEAARLSKVMDELGCVNIFLSEGAGVESIVEEMLAQGQEPQRDAFGHVKLDTINPGAWFGKNFAAAINAEKTLVQKSGYFGRSAAANEADRKLIADCAKVAVETALVQGSGVVGHDEDQSDELRAIEFPRIAGGKPFDANQQWFDQLLLDLGQPKTSTVEVKH